MARAFVIRPFGTKTDGAGRAIDFEAIHAALIGPVLEQSELAGSTTGEIVDAGNIREDMFSLILEADLVLCDVTVHNANVFYELGIRHALRKRRTILLRGKQSGDVIPFDLLTDRYLAYDLDAPQAARAALADMIAASLASDRDTDSPVFRMLPGLGEADAAAVQAVPLDFREDIDRAVAARARGWLRLLAEDLRGRRFEWVGLRLLARAQFRLTDYEAARSSLEQLRTLHPGDVEANLLLATVYERLAKERDDATLLAASEGAIARVLAAKDATAQQRGEALTLRGRNHKTEWRRALAGLPTLEERRAAALGERLRASYAAYRAAFDQDLNHCWAGLTAAQMGTIFLDLSSGDDRTWMEWFDSDEEAEAFRRAVERDVRTLHLLVPAAIEAARRRRPPGDPERTWAEVARADVLFLTERNEGRVRKRYRDAVPRDDPFLWDAARNQLQLFADLGVRAELARSIVAEVDARQPRPAVDAPEHVVIFAGHRFDAPGRTEPRFPCAAADRARALIQEQLGELARGVKLRGLAAGTPGGDLLFHEACEALGVESTLCLPIPADAYARQQYAQDAWLDEWRSRFLALRQRRPVWELSDRADAPGWLRFPPTDLAERGFRWVMQLALTCGAQRVTLLALWDGRTDEEGGTAQLVERARAAGRIDVRVIDARQLAVTPAVAPPDVASTSVPRPSHPERRHAQLP